MAVQITHVRFSGYNKSEETIIAYRWVNPSDGKTGDSDKPTIRALIGSSSTSSPEETAFSAARSALSEITSSRRAR